MIRLACFEGMSTPDRRMGIHLPISQGFWEELEHSDTDGSDFLFAKLDSHLVLF